MNELPTARSGASKALTKSEMDTEIIMSILKATAFSVALGVAVIVIMLCWWEMDE